MTILIDGYNLLNATGIDGRGTAGRTELERARVALLNVLTRSLSAAERALTTIVFDAKQAPPGLPSELTHGEMQVRFARGYPSADDLIEELIAADHSPRQLVVVSSDHRLHRAARRRKATALDSDVWISSLGKPKAPTSEAAPIVSESETTATTTSSWLSEFGDIDVAAIAADVDRENPAPAPQRSTDEKPSPRGGQRKQKPVEQPKPGETLKDAKNIFPPDLFDESVDEPRADDDWNPFPPGYGADVEP